MLSISDLTDEQQELINKAKENKNILVDACIGSGKTTAIQLLCNEFSSKQILYLTYNKLLKLDAKDKIIGKNVTVTNYHGFAYMCLARIGIKVGQSELLTKFNYIKPTLSKYDLLVIDEYQDIDQDSANMLEIIKDQNPNIQIIAVGDTAQKIYDWTTLNVLDFMNDFLGPHETLQFTKCFRLSFDLANMLGRIWNKKIIGVNDKCKVETMSIKDVSNLLSTQSPKDILCLGSTAGTMAKVLNYLEKYHSKIFNKKTVYATIRNDGSQGCSSPSDKTAIFTTYDGSKGLERKICVVFDYTKSYWNVRLNQPMQKYEILRNVFCVAASRGKNHIIFVDSGDDTLDEETLSIKPINENMMLETLYASDMFSFKYKEDIENCFSKLDVYKVHIDDETTININTTDGLIDLSPCIGIYQEAVFFKNYDIDGAIEYEKKVRSNEYINNCYKSNFDLDHKILWLIAHATSQERYIKQVKIPFITKEQQQKIVDRLYTVFNSKELVQKKCGIQVFTNKNSFNIEGVADVVKDDLVYELKFVSELQHEHFLQCACYMIAMNLEKGILWNVKSNQMYKIYIPDKDEFMKAVVKVVSKGYNKLISYTTLTI